MNLLPVSLAHAVKEQQSTARWLVEDLWAEQAVGIIGGEPKCCKSFLTQQVLNILESATEPVRIRTLRDALTIRHASVSHIVQSLVQRGIVTHTNNGVSMIR